MSYKDGNEITIRVKCSENKLKEILRKDKFILKSEYYAKDIFLIPKSINIFEFSTREVLSKAILLREFQGITSDKHKMKITIKHKRINNNGEILSQNSINCEIKSIEDAKEIFEDIGYKEIMTIKEKHFAYFRDDFNIIIKVISNDNILIEAELNEKYKDIDALKKAINNTNIPFDSSNYFVKKAEEELNKIKSGDV